MTPRRLIEEAFPLRKVAEDSKHEKNVCHGHISTLHIWPADRESPFERNLSCLPKSKP